MSKYINDKNFRQSIEIREPLPEYVNGITSFDYERIKAQESLERDISLYVTFAVKAFSQAICSEDVLRELGTDKEGNEDVLQMSKKYLQQVIYKDSKRRILQFFGGQSAWETDDMEYKKLSITSMGKIKKEELSGIELTEVMKMEIGKVAGLELVETMKKQLSLIRNSSFHYTSVLELENKSLDAIAEKLFLKEYGEIGEKYREKYYTNNVPMFYSVNDINTLMNKLYSAPKNIPAQVPAFNKIIKKTDLFQVIQELSYKQDESEKGKVNKSDLQKDCVNFRSDISKMGEADREKFNSAFLFILKEIYYYDFLRNAQNKTIFMHALDKMLKEAKEKKHQYATKDIISRIESMGENVSLGEICQRIITDYNMQNNDKMVKSSGDAKIKKDEQSYKHFKLLLYEGLRAAFLTYLKKEIGLEKEIIKNVKKESSIYAFLLKPVLRENPEEKEFCKSWKTDAFISIKKTIKEEPVFLAWYIIVHFLTQRQLNHLIGSIKNYIQYVTDINKRAKNTQNRVSKNTKSAVKRYKKLISVLECSMFFCEQITNHVTDYFDDGDEKRERCAKESYAECLSDFVDFVPDDVLQNNEELFQENPYANALNEFCEQSVKQGSPNGKIGIYYDAVNPVINRNIVKAMMYGNLKILSECMVPVTENEILDLYEKKQELKNVFKEGRCANKKEQELLKVFQNLKNRVELLDVLIYSEIMNELLAQLISWAYLRERDMMYLQLGFHYMELFYSDKIKKDSVQRKLECKELNITDGAILYQIVAMYTHQLPVIVFDEEKKPYFSKKQDRGTGKSIANFVFNYSNIHVYNAGLCFFENIAEHDAITAFRNYIDHFKYYVKRDRSIMDLYSEVYDRFFTYDPKLKKSVTFIFKNILMKYFVKADTTMEISKEQRKKVYSIKKDGKQIAIEKEAAKISLKYKKGLQTDYFNYKIVDQDKKTKQVKIAARTDIFLKQLSNILEYEK